MAVTFITVALLLMFLINQAENGTASELCIADIQIDGLYSYYKTNLLIPTPIYEILSSDGKDNPPVNCPKLMEAYEINEADILEDYSGEENVKLLGRCLTVSNLIKTSGLDYVKYNVSCACEDYRCKPNCEKEPCSGSGYTETIFDEDRILGVDCHCVDRRVLGEPIEPSREE